jgi:hypothetical protein
MVFNSALNTTSFIGAQIASTYLIHSAIDKMPRSFFKKNYQLDNQTFAMIHRIITARNIAVSMAVIQKIFTSEESLSSAYTPPSLAGIYIENKAINPLTPPLIVNVCERIFNSASDIYNEYEIFKQNLVKLEITVNLYNKDKNR